MSYQDTEASLEGLTNAQRFAAQHPFYIGLVAPSLFAGIFLLLSLVTTFGTSDAVLLSVLSYVVGILVTVYAEAALARNRVEVELARKDSEIAILFSEAKDLRERITHVVTSRAEKLDVSIANFSNFLTYVPLYVAEEGRFFREENIAAQIESYQDDLGAIKALANRSDYFAISDPMFAFHPDLVGDELKIIAPFINKVAVWALTPLNLAELLSGGYGHVVDDAPKSIVTFDETTTAYRLAARLGKKLNAAGVETSNILTVGRRQDEDIHTFFNRNFVDGRQGILDNDILVFSEPEISYLRHYYPNAVVYSLHDILYPGSSFFAFTSILARKRTIKLEAELVRRFLRALQHAQTFVYSLPRLPAETGHAEEVARTSGWETTIRAVRTNIARSYPAEISSGMSDLEIAKLIDSLRRSSFFSSSAANYKDFMAGLNSACALSRGTQLTNIKEMTLSEDELRDLLYG